MGPPGHGRDPLPCGARGARDALSYLPLCQGWPHAWCALRTREACAAFLSRRDRHRGVRAGAVPERRRARATLLILTCPPLSTYSCCGFRIHVSLSSRHKPATPLLVCANRESRLSMLSQCGNGQVTRYQLSQGRTCRLFFWLSDDGEN